MRVDYKKFPDMPPHCQLNAKPNRPGEFQVFRENRVLDPATGKKKTVRENHWHHQKRPIHIQRSLARATGTSKVA